MIGVLVPDRGDRPQFLENCKRMIKAQTLEPALDIVVNFEPESNKTDLTRRVREGFELLKEAGCECVLIMENDDFYSPEYIETIYKEWIKAGRPEIFGTNATIYYHIAWKQYRVLKHPRRASLMNTLISCRAGISWPDDSEVFLDLNLWNQLKGKTFSAPQGLSLGIKHGEGLCGGRGHSFAPMFQEDDPDSSYLKSLTDPESFDFYVGKSEEILKARSNQNQQNNQLLS